LFNTYYYFQRIFYYISIAIVSFGIIFFFALIVQLGYIPKVYLVYLFNLLKNNLYVLYIFACFILLILLARELKYMYEANLANLYADPWQFLLILACLCWILLFGLTHELQQIHEAILVNNQNILEQNQYVNNQIRLFHLSQEQLQARFEFNVQFNNKTIIFIFKCLLFNKFIIYYLTQVFKN